MKRISLLAMFLLLVVPSVYAQEATPTTEPKPSVAKEEATPLDDTIKSLKEKIEDKVEQINKTSKKIVKGVIESVSEDTIEILTDTDNSFTVSLDETISTYFGTTYEGSESIEQTDLEKGDYIVVSGPIIEDQISANIIYKQKRYSVLQGQITTTDTSDFSIGIVTPEKDEYTLDIEDETTQFIMDTETLVLEKGGFSKYKVGDNIHVVIETPDDIDKNVSAIRTLIIPQEYFVHTDETDDAEASPEVEE